MSNFAFPRGYRLFRKADIKNVFRTGKKRRLLELNIFFCPNQLSHARLCVTISKKSVSKSYLRNMIKRIVRESFRLNQHLLPAYDIVVIVYKPMSLLDKQTMRETLEKQWQKLA